MNTLRGITRTALVLAGLVAAMMMISCSESPTRAEEFVDIVPWKVDVRVPGLQLADLFPDVSSPIRVEPNYISFHVTQAVETPQVYSDQMLALEMTDERQDEVRRALERVFPSWLVSDKVLALVRLDSLDSSEFWIDSTMHMGDLKGGYQYWFSLAIRVDDVRIAVAGVPEAGLAEACILADYKSIDEFDQLAHQYLNLSEDEKAEDDYRPTRGLSTASGLICVDSGSWRTEGYRIRVEEEYRKGRVRSFTRDFSSPDGGQTLTTIEFNLSYGQEVSKGAD